MNRLKGYHRPNNVEDALQLLNRSEVKTAVLAGGTSLIANLPDEVDEVVDLQVVGLNRVSHEADQMTIASMVTLQTLVEDQEAPNLLRRMAHREGPNTFRNAATIGGVIAGADPESELLAALLVMETAVSIQTQTETKTVTLSDFLKNVGSALQGGVITAVSLRKLTQTAHARVARTPQDKPIVAAVAAKTEQGELRLALCGVAETAVLIKPASLDTLMPHGDFRGSSSYRKQMAAVLTNRVLNELTINPSESSE
ncbi:MAG: hypothetical protein DWQ04_29670 [Chloroflexi bacterium]|nr:MAG: hypothetical protein DWQ04_29670 [Chloroflexota bacterium]